MQTFKKENLKSWDLLSYIESVTGCKAKKAGNNTYKFQECPICGSGGHFTINTIGNYFTTWDNCSKGGTIVDFYMVYNKKTQMEAITELLGNDIMMQEIQRFKKKRVKVKSTANHEKVKTVDFTTSILEYYNKHTGKIVNREFGVDMEKLYFYHRNLPDWIIDKYKLFCCNPKEVFPADLLPRLSSISDWEYIIPIWRVGKVVNAMLRRNDNKTIYGEKTYNLKGLPLEIINSEYVNQEHKLVCVCEGFFDAMSLEVLGFKAICLNSANMADKLLKIIKLGNKVKKYFIFGDNDSTGKELNKKFIDGLSSMGIECIVFDDYKGDFEIYKDVNDFYCCEDEKLKKNIKRCFHKNGK